MNKKRKTLSLVFMNLSLSIFFLTAMGFVQFITANAQNTPEKAKAKVMVDDKKMPKPDEDEWSSSETLDSALLGNDTKKLEPTNLTAKSANNDSPKTQNSAAEPAKSLFGDDDSKKISDGRYRIGRYDKIEVQVYRHPELNLLATIDEGGKIRLPRMEKEISVLCKTESEVQQEIVNGYKWYLREPFVNVVVREQNSQPFAVIGAVEKPGQFFLNRRIRLLELLAYAGGPNKLAGAKLQIARVGGFSSCEPSKTADEVADNQIDQVFQQFKIRDTLEGKDAANPWMSPGDIVSVLDVEQAYVVGNVFKPEKIPLKEPVTISQAIAFAGGVLPATKKEMIRILRQEEGSPVRREIIVNLKEIEAKRAADIVLLPNDIVDVPTDGRQKVKDGIVKALTNGIPNIFYKIPL